MAQSNDWWQPQEGLQQTKNTAFWFPVALVPEYAVLLEGYRKRQSLKMDDMVKLQWRYLVTLHAPPK
jgi:hypothetical protein